MENYKFLILSPKVVRDAPWEYDEEFLEKHKIDFIAHDDIPYITEDCDDIYAMIKAKDMFVATERTEGEYSVYVFLTCRYFFMVNYHFYRDFSHI